MKMQAPLFKHYCQFQDGESRTLNQAGGPSEFRPQCSCQGHTPASLVLFLPGSSELSPGALSGFQTTPGLRADTVLPSSFPKVSEHTQGFILMCSFGFGPQISCLPFSLQNSTIMLSPLYTLATSHLPPDGFCPLHNFSTLQFLNPMDTVYFLLIFIYICLPHMHSFIQHILKGSCDSVMMLSI